MAGESNEQRKMRHLLVSQKCDPNKLQEVMISRVVELVKQKKITEEDGREMIKDCAENARLLRSLAAAREPDEKLLAEARAEAATARVDGAVCKVCKGACSGHAPGRSLAGAQVGDRRSRDREKKAGGAARRRARQLTAGAAADLPPPGTDSGGQAHNNT